MPLPFFFKRQRDTSNFADAGPASSDPAALAQARMRARHRLIGATVLVVVSVAGFPILFDSKPRPLPSDLSVQVVKSSGDIQTSRPEPAAPVAEPVSRAASVAQAVVPGPASRPESVQRALVSDAAQAPRVASSAKPAQAQHPSTPSAQPTAASAAQQAIAARGHVTAASAHEVAHLSGRDVGKGVAHEADRAKALLEGREPVAAHDVEPVVADTSAGSAAASATRYIVQVGAFADASSAHQVRLKVEHLGLKTYTQVIDGPGGKRIRVRVGPFTQKSAADQAVGKIKQSGLSAAVLTL